MPTCVEGINAFMTSVLNPSRWFEPCVGSLVVLGQYTTVDNRHGVSLVHLLR